MQMRHDAFGVRPFDGALLNGLQDFAVHIDREECAVAVSHVVAPENGVDPVSPVPDHIEQLQTAVELGVEYVDHEFGLFHHPDEEPLRSHDARVGDVEPEPERVLQEIILARSVLPI